jgi:hypothetical protein
MVKCCLSVALTGLWLYLAPYSQGLTPLAINSRRFAAMAYLISRLNARGY